MTIIIRNGVSLSAHAGLNGMPLRPIITPGVGDYAERTEGRDRRRVRRRRIAEKHAYLMGA